ncbi:MAG: DUF3365 domain-containing protein [Candidatus Schekmanbacteria bacterium]|nr:MAG: DUF3365 domain-containing protein [Candidatus Schekmanbacteria bacterium]
MNQSTAQYRIKIYLVFLLCLFFTVDAISLYINVKKTRQQFHTFAQNRGQAFFKAFVVARRWNAMHGGVYIFVTENSQPNVYLEDPLRDIETKEGMKLTKVNPAYMTRMISEYLKNDSEVHIHLTSLKPLNPSNKPDQWEAKMLKKFEEGMSEVSDVTNQKGVEIFRYMAPLLVEESCLKCHEKQGYKIGDVRGGLSVSFPYTSYQNATSEALKRIYIIHILFFIIFALIIYYLGRFIVRNIAALEESIAHINQLEGILPICSSCKKIKDEKGEWQMLESYMRRSSDVKFSHGLCPDCAKKLYPDYYKNDLGKKGSDDL